MCIRDRGEARKKLDEMVVKGKVSKPKAKKVSKKGSKGKSKMGK